MQSLLPPPPQLLPPRKKPRLDCGEPQRRSYGAKAAPIDCDAPETDEAREVIDLAADGISSAAGAAGSRADVVVVSDESDPGDADSPPPAAAAAVPAANKRWLMAHSQVPVVEARSKDPLLTPQSSLAAAQAAALAAAGGLPKWPRGAPVPYAAAAHCLAVLEATTGRLAASAALTNLIATSLTHTEPAAEGAECPTGQLLRLLTGVISDPWSGTQLNVGRRLLMAAASRAFGMSTAELEKHCSDFGDLGDAMERAVRKQRRLVPDAGGELSCAAVLAELRALGAEKGQGARKQRQDLVASLLRRLSPREGKYIVRTTLGAIRVGASTCTVLDALGRAAALVEHGAEGVPPSRVSDEAAAAVRAAFRRRPALSALCAEVRARGWRHLDAEWRATLMTPVTPMLGLITRTIPPSAAEAMVADWKYDGVRAQIHYRAADGGEGQVKIFSRHLEDSTAKLPAVAHRVAEWARRCGLSDFIMDAEICAVRGESLLAMQAMAGGGAAAHASMCVYAFDLLILNGVDMLRSPFQHRRQRLAECFRPALASGDLQLVRWAEVPAGPGAVETVVKLCREAIASGCEGVMLKRLEEAYEPGVRAGSWLKVKGDYLASGPGAAPAAASSDVVSAGVVDTIDVVPIGAWRGTGRKHGWLSPFLCAVYDPDTQVYHGFCKVMTGFSDAHYREFSERLGAQCVGCRPPYVLAPDSLHPSFWLAPTEVWEIAGAELTISPLYTAAAGFVPGTDKGLSLRFPRFLRCRPDKPPEEATTTADLARMYSLQVRRG